MTRNDKEIRYFFQNRENLDRLISALQKFFDFNPIRIQQYFRELGNSSARNRLQERKQFRVELEAALDLLDKVRNLFRKLKNANRDWKTAFHGNGTHTNGTVLADGIAVPRTYDNIQERCHEMQLEIESLQQEIEVLYNSEAYQREAARQKKRDQFVQLLKDVRAQLAASHETWRVRDVANLLDQLERLIVWLRSETRDSAESIARLTELKEKVQEIYIDYRAAISSENAEIEIEKLQEDLEIKLQIIILFKRFLVEHLSLIDNRATEYFVYKRTKKKTANRHDGKLPPLFNRNYDYSQFSRLDKYRFALLGGIFYLTLFILDGALWGGAILAPLFLQTGYFGATLLDMVQSPTSTWGDLTMVLLFHLLSFVIVLVLSRIPLRLAFFARLLHYLEQQEHGRLLVERLNFRSGGEILFRLAKYVFGLKRFRKPAFAMIIWGYYFILILLPLLASHFIHLSAVALLLSGLIFWSVLHVLYRFFGEYGFIVKTLFMPGVLSKQIDLYTGTLDSEIDIRQATIEGRIKLDMKVVLQPLEERIDYLLGMYDDDPGHVNGLLKQLEMLKAELKMKQDLLREWQASAGKLQDAAAPLLELEQSVQEQLEAHQIDWEKLQQVDTDEIREIARNYGL